MIAVVPLCPDSAGLLGARCRSCSDGARAMQRDDRRRPGPGRDLRHREPRRAPRSTCTPRSASSTTPGPRSAPTTSTGGRGPTTPSSRPSWSTRAPRTTSATPAGCGSPSPPSTSTGVADDVLESTASTPAAHVRGVRRVRGRARRLARRRPGRAAATRPAAPAPAARARAGSAALAAAGPYLVLHDPDGRPPAAAPARTSSESTRRNWRWVSVKPVPR